jgi:hypothetical protein
VPSSQRRKLVGFQWLDRRLLVPGLEVKQRAGIKIRPNTLKAYRPVVDRQKRCRLLVGERDRIFFSWITLASPSRARRARRERADQE